jgi:hypothetical protein
MIIMMWRQKIDGIQKDSIYMQALKQRPSYNAVIVVVTHLSYELKIDWFFEKLVIRERIDIRMHCSTCLKH